MASYGKGSLMPRWTVPVLIPVGASDAAENVAHSTGTLDDGSLCSS
jgi:hypothetical protein